MGREQAGEEDALRRLRATRNRTELAACLEGYGVGPEFAREVANTYFTRGAGTALIHLYAGGWEVIRAWVDDDDGTRVERLTIERTLGEIRHGS